MRYLLDTHAFLWLASSSPQLSDRCSEVYLDSANDCFLSMVSVWEMAIKLSIGKLELETPLARLVEIARDDQGLRLLDIELEHVLLVQTLPFHHRDPFDRLIISQALTEQLPIVGRDAIFDDYGVDRLW